MMHAKNKFFFKLSITNFKQFVFQGYETFLLEIYSYVKNRSSQICSLQKKSGRKENLIKQT